MILSWKAVARTLGGLLLFLGVALLIPACVGLYYAEASWWSFVAAAAVAFAIGGGSWAALGRPGQADDDEPLQDALGVREGFAIVALSWFLLSLIGALPMRLGGEVVPDNVMRNVLSFIVLYFMLNGFGIVIMSILGMDLMSAFGATIACVGNIGPGFGSVGPTDNYAHIPAVGKWILSLMMMAGRLEIFTVLILLVPTFWRR